jgi:hypothetical protein
MNVKIVLKLPSTIRPNKILFGPVLEPVVRVSRDAHVVAKARKMHSYPDGQIMSGSYQAALCGALHARQQIV